MESSGTSTLCLPSVIKTENCRHVYGDEAYVLFNEKGSMDISGGWFVCPSAACQRYHSVQHISGTRVFGKETEKPCLVMHHIAMIDNFRKGSLRRADFLPLHKPVVEDVVMEDIQYSEPQPRAKQNRRARLIRDKTRPGPYSRSANSRRTPLGRTDGPS